MWPMLHHTHPDVLLVDLHHPGRDGLTLSEREQGLLQEWLDRIAVAGR